MCGIAGFCNYNTDYSNTRGYWNNVLVDMRERIAHRGSDSFGEYLRQNIGFSHTRLSIRDLCGGTQPMVRYAGDSEYAIVYNGEIYNIDEIKPELQKNGFAFNTTTDTEVILYAYIHYGIDFVSKLNGIFAFAIWDSKRNKLLLYRDRLGVKPLFYTIKNNTLVFGSEIKALFCHPEIKPIIDMNSFREVFGIGPARTSGQGVFKDIYELKPGNYAVFSQDGFWDSCYWEILATKHTDSYEQTVEKVSYLIQDAIKRQMVSDVPVCSFLSGGLDSSVVTAVASDYLLKSGAKLNTFSFDFTGNDIHFKSNSFQPERDKLYVEKMLDICDVNHTYLECEENRLVDMLNTVVDAKDIPGMADVDASLIYFCSLVKEHNKVALTGECADEIFGGYPWFYKKELMSVDGFPWSYDMGARTMLLSDDFIAELNVNEYVKEKYNDSLKIVPYIEGETESAKKHREISYLNIKWFMQTLLDRMDRASMYSGLEARVPFADHRIVEYLFNVPWEMKYKDGVEKSLLREACRGLLPDEILFRKKSPYPKTYNPNYEKLLCSNLSHIIENPNSPIFPYLDKKKVLSFIKAPTEYGKPWFGQLMASPQLMAYIIQVNYWLGKIAM